MAREKIGAGELKTLAGVTIVDIRKNPDDRQIPGSVRPPDDAIVSHPERVILSLSKDVSKEQPVVLYCGSGNSCSRVAAELRELGYNATALDGGYKAWLDAGFETEKRSPMSS